MSAPPPPHDPWRAMVEDRLIRLEGRVGALEAAGPADATLKVIVDILTRLSEQTKLIGDKQQEQFDALTTQLAALGNDPRIAAVVADLQTHTAALKAALANAPT